MIKNINIDMLLEALYDADAISARGAKIIRKFLTVENAQIIRCGDCKWWTKQESSAQGRCVLLGNYPTATWFCANGISETKGGQDDV